MHGLQMFVLVILVIYFNAGMASNDERFANGWIPIERSNVFSKIRNNYFETRYSSAWNPYQSSDINNIDYIKEKAIQIIPPEQAQTRQYDKTVSVTLPAAAAIRENATNNKGTLHPLPDQEVSKFLPRPETDSQRAPKHLKSVSSTNLLSDPLDKPLIKSTSAESDTVVSIIKNISNNHYEVTESSNVQELSDNEYDKNLGYIYQRPQVPVLLQLFATHNEYTKKFMEVLSKYNIKPQDMLNNYDLSKRHYPKMKLQHPVSPVSLLPFRYNSLNHQPVDPLLAVLLSNYGYYLKGFYGISNSYKNLYGYLASNNIHNNKPFGPYKVYSDTDSSN